ncbi:Root UVB sensitive family [Babesia duncani]|uniref:Root UVB sensitive family n=1 Tax=Babesia duncani TaxID=323732 RepID=A0AAD9PKJ1_9APIC|nr:Root UVB sensitive family [Babesia duncani]
MKCLRFQVWCLLQLWISINEHVFFAVCRQIHSLNFSSLSNNGKQCILKPFNLSPGLIFNVKNWNACKFNDPVFKNGKSYQANGRLLFAISKSGFIGNAFIKKIETHKFNNRRTIDQGTEENTIIPSKSISCYALKNDSRHVTSFTGGIRLLVNSIKQFLYDLIYPYSVRREYYHYAHWRMLERIFLSASQVIASNVKQEFSYNPLKEVKKGPFFWMKKLNDGKVGHALATIVIKDVISRILHFLWFGKIGVGFDDNPKAFRLVGCMLFTLSNIADFIKNICGFEPKVLITMCSNIVRHLGLLTMSASQGPFYNSFHIKNAATNIGEITAKLEAQNPVCDFLGIACATYLLQFLDNQKISTKALAFAIANGAGTLASYMAVKSVVFRNLNAPRCFIVLEDFASILLRRLDRYLRYHTTQLEKLNEDSDDIASSSNSCFDDDECGAIAELIYNYEFDTATKLLHRFTSVHLCNKLRAAREMPRARELSGDENITVDEYLVNHNDTLLPGEPLNLVQNKIKIKFLTPEDVAKREPLQFPGTEGVLRMGAIKYSLNDLSVCQATLTEYLKIFKGEKFVVVLGSNGVVEASIHPHAKPRDAVMAILTYNIAEKLWTVVTESTETEFGDLQFDQIWDMCKRSAVGLKEVLLHLQQQNRPRRKLSTDGQQLKEEKETWKRGIQTVIYAYTMAKACIDEVVSNIEAAHWDVDKFEFCN